MWICVEKRVCDLEFDVSELKEEKKQLSEN